jgi:hypothetical protein
MSGWRKHSRAAFHRLTGSVATLWPRKVEGNRLKGCLGADVLECDILKSLRAVIMSPIPPVVIKPEAVPVSFGNNKSEEHAEAVRCPFLLRFLAESTCAGLPVVSMSLFGHTLPI